MPPPRRPKHEAVFSQAAFSELKNWDSSKTASMSDAIRATWEGFKALDAAGYDVIDRRTGEPIPFVDGDVREVPS